jgi:ATP-dependent helicase/nuclease subunit A
MRAKESSMSDSGLLALDEAARRRALDAHASFIVRAPAGSGKTELLIQRVLALLATVEQPEEVVAITFTRKAAAEMRQRLIDALELARVAAPPEQAHRRLTHALARAVVERDAGRGWNIVANPGRLRVMTIDALAQWLARQLPVALGLGAAPNVTERADELYEAAARATLAAVEGGAPDDRQLAPHVARLLAHLDNDIERAVGLLSTMLGRRDQWLRHLRGHERETLESALQRACERTMRHVGGLLPADAIEELVELARYAAANGGAGGQLAPWAELTALPDAASARIDAWRGLASMLLTKDGHWRTRFAKGEGFPAGSTAEEKRRSRPYVDRINALRDALARSDELRDALDALRGLPPPHYGDDQWQLVQAIVEVLRRAAAELAIVFAETGTMDFAEVTRRAVRALGDEGGGEVALALDARLQHLLIDEFQDTSITQFELVEQLVAEWTPGDGRTLFVVGDPMQSIYRFREAEVGLFLRAWTRGIGPVALEPLRLARNFRSQQGIVEWVNQAFAQVLPVRSDIASGAVSFEPAVAVHTAALDPAVVVHALVEGGARDEADRVVDVVRAIRADEPQASIALLVRARRHLLEIAVALRRAGMKPTAVELHALASRPLISDLLALTRALEHGADRTAWLAVLRAPWCGLTLADLAALAEGGRGRRVSDLLADAACLERLSPDGRARAGRADAVFRRADALRGRLGTSDRVEQAWLLLGGPACVASAAEHEDAEQFFTHLAQHEAERGGRVDVHVLQRSLQSLFASPDTGSDPAFQVMTIHKAKGLEFDHVIVPGLAAAPRHDEAQLMAWLERASDDGPELLLAPIHAGGAEKDGLLRWLESELQQRQRREDERLAYVAATRARQRLHWIACVRLDANGAPLVSDASLLARLWPAIEQDVARAPVEPHSKGREADLRPFDQSLRRLPAGWRLPELPGKVRWSSAEPTRDSGTAVEYSWAGETARRVGTVVHRWLQRMAEDALEGWDAARVRTIAPQIERSLAAGGLSGDELAAARARVSRALLNAVQDDRGRWVLGAHPEQRSELRLSMVQDGRVRRMVLDRTFVAADGRRWIVDYKVGVHEGADVDAFLDAEQLRYRGQLETYGRALDRNAVLGLYFPLVPGWREWIMPPENSEARAGSADMIRSGGPPRTEVP